MRLYLLLLMSLIMQIGYSQQDSIFLWNEGEEPFGLRQELLKETHKNTRVSNVVRPAIFPFISSATDGKGKAVIICPGGGYRFLSIEKEGMKVAEWFQSKGISAFVLKNRLPSDAAQTKKELAPKVDLRKAALIVKENASEWGIDPEKIGIMGFSAGGHLASTGATHTEAYTYDEVELPAFNPYFNVLVYPVLSMEDGVTHQGSKRNLLGENPSNELVERYSTDKQVSEQTAPTFLIGSSDDQAVPIENSIRFYQALMEKGVYKSELHVYSYGGHGFGFAEGKGHLSSWRDRLFDWLDNL